MGLVWSRDNITLPNNRVMAEACLRHLARRLVKVPELLEQYQKYVSEMIRCGKAVVDQRTYDRSSREWFLQCSDEWVPCAIKAPH